MMLNYDRGNPSEPRGHALLYFQSWGDPATVFATYVIVPPIVIELSKYIPPMFANQFQQMSGRGISVFPYPPIPEQAESRESLDRMAAARHDDLISGGMVDTTSPERLLQASTEAAQQYFEAYSSYMASLPSTNTAESLPEEAGKTDLNEIVYGLMGDRERLAELAKLSGQLRYAVGGKDKVLADETLVEVKRLARYLPDKYRADEVAEAAQRPGQAGDRLTQLYLDRAYRLADEDYEGVQQIEEEIRRLK